MNSNENKHPLEDKPFLDQQNIENKEKRIENMKKRVLINHIQIIFTCVLFFSIFGGLFFYLCKYVKENETVLINNSYNSRQDILLSRNYRGTIYSRNGEVLAETVLDDNQNETRVYPYGPTFAHIVGYNTQGKMGIEASANYYLINTNISISSKVNNDINEVKNPGDNVYSTLDVSLQQIADNYLSAFQGAVVVTEVKTGKVLAMVSHPSFDPNEIDMLWNQLINDNKSSVLLNRATQGAYPPGSTFKILTALEFYRENKDNWKNYSFNCTGSYTKDDVRINCYHKSVHGGLDFTKSFAKSCNSSFSNIGMKLDRDKFQTTLNTMLFNSDLPITLNYSKSMAHSNYEMDTEAMMQTAIGQGKTTISPMHLNMITCAIANKGVLMKPYFVDYVQSAEGNIVKKFKSEEYGRLMTEEEADFLTTQMAAVVKSGTATKLAGLSYTSAGKTGSAEYNSLGDSHAWFTGFAPVEDPEIALTIIVESAGSGGDFAVPLAKRIFDCYFDAQ